MKESDRPVGKRRFNGQDLEVWARGGKRQPGFRKDREEASGFKETNPRFVVKDAHGRARIVKSTGAKCLHKDRPKRAFQRGQRPQFVYQLGKLDPSPARPWILHACHNNEWLVVELFKAQLLVCKRAESLSDHE